MKKGNRWVIASVFLATLGMLSQSGYGYSASYPYFPDLRHYRFVPKDRYHVFNPAVPEISAKISYQIRFKTSEGIGCLMDNTGYVHCSRPIVSSHRCIQQPAYLTNRSYWWSPAQPAVLGQKTSLDCHYPQDAGAHLLANGTKVNIGGVTCAANYDQFVGCIGSHRHGFILSKNGDNAF